MQKPNGRARQHSKERKAISGSAEREAWSAAPLRAGDHAPEIKLIDASGEPTSLIFALKSGPVVISFLSGRGGTLSRELKAISEHLADIEAAGAVVFAVSPIVEPDASRYYTFKILYDAGSSVASAYGLCPLPIKHSPADISAAAAPGDHGAIPATFVVDQRSLIVLSLTDAAFDNDVVPINVVSALNALRGLKREKP